MAPDKKINILFVLPNFDTGGSEKLVVDLATHLDPTIFNPVICAFFTGAYETTVRARGIPFYCIHEGGRIRSKPAMIQCLNTIIRRHHIDIVNTHHTSPLIQGFIPFCILNHPHWIHTEHTRLDQDPNVTARIRVLAKLLLRFVSRVVGISQGVCEYFHRELGVPRSKIIKILNGIDCTRFTFSPEERQKRRSELRERLHINETDIVIGLFANFRKQKNHPLLLNALHLLRSQGLTNIKLVLAGDGPERQAIEQMIHDLSLESCVLLLGMRSDIPELMNMIDIYCLPSRFEGLPFSLIEAFAAGKPVVATDVDGNRDVINEMGAGRLVEPDNPHTLAAALYETTVSLSAKNNNEHCDPSSFVFSFDKMLSLYTHLFKEIR